MTDQPHITHHSLWHVCCRAQLVWLPACLRLMAACLQRSATSLHTIDALLGCPLALPDAALFVDGRYVANSLGNHPLPVGGQVSGRSGCRSMAIHKEGDDDGMGTVTTSPLCGGCRLVVALTVACLLPVRSWDGLPLPSKVAVLLSLMHTICWLREVVAVFAPAFNSDLPKAAKGINAQTT